MTHLYKNFAPTLTGLGYDTTPVLGKRPILKGWSERPDVALEYEAHAERSIGIVLGGKHNLIAIDVDVTNPFAANAIEKLIQDTLGDAPKRIGKAPKFLMVFRTDEPMKKIKTRVFDIEATDEDGCVEVLAEGQQFVAFGIHPDTEQEYQWPGDDLTEYEIKSIPLIKKEDVSIFIEAADNLLGDYGIAKQQLSPSKNSVTKNRLNLKEKRAPLEEIQAALAHIPNKDAHYDEWVNVAHAIKGACGDEGFSLFQKWSAISSKHDAYEDERLWKSIDKVENIGAGSIFEWARRNGFEIAQHRHADGESDWVSELNQRYAMVNDGGVTLVFKETYDPELRRQIIERSKPSEFSRLLSNQHVPIGEDKAGNLKYEAKGKAWLSHPKRRSYTEGVVFVPSGEVPNGYYNLWRGYGVEPHPGDWSLMQRHIREVICGGNSQYQDYLIAWLARMFQNPAKQGEVAVVLRGGKGCGKGTLGNALIELMPSHALHLSSSDQLVGRFNHHLRDAVFVFADEAFFAGSKPDEGVLKAIITEPRITIEAKYSNSIQCANHTHILMATNNAWAVPASSDERRYFVLDVSSERRGDQEYFSAIKHQLEHGGYEAMLHDFLHFDLSGFNHRDVPKTSALRDQKILSLQGILAYLFECLDDGLIPMSEGDPVHWGQSPTISKENAYQAFKMRATDYRCGGHPPPKSVWVREINKVFSGNIQNTKHRGFKSFVLPELEQGRAIFAEKLGQEIEWTE